MSDTAEFSPCRTWRYTLNREWGDGPKVAFLMANPSTADESRDDPTIRKCRGFSQRWGYGSMVILNLFAIRGTDPRIIGQSEDPVGPDNDHWIRESLAGCDEVICAWGCGQWIKGRNASRPIHVVANILTDYPKIKVWCLGLRKDEHPRHPLMLSYATERRSLWGKEEE